MQEHFKRVTQVALFFLTARLNFCSTIHRRRLPQTRWTSFTTVSIYLSRLYALS